MEGVMSGTNMLEFVDLGKSAIDRHLPLLDWVRSWTQIPELVPLAPEGWFEEGHGIAGGAKDARVVWIPSHGYQIKLSCERHHPLLSMLLWKI